MLAIVKAVVLTALVVVQLYHLTLHCIIEVLALDEHVRAENDLVGFWDQGSIHEAVTCLELHVDLRLEDEVVCQ